MQTGCRFQWMKCTCVILHNVRLGVYWGWLTRILNEVNFLWDLITADNEGLAGPLSIISFCLFFKEQLLCTINRQNGCHFADNIFKWIFMNEHSLILIRPSLKFEIHLITKYKFKLNNYAKIIWMNNSKLHMIKLIRRWKGPNPPYDSKSEGLLYQLTHCGFVSMFGHIHLGQHKVITGRKVDLSWFTCPGKYINSILMEKTITSLLI